MRRLACLLVLVVLVTCVVCSLTYCRTTQEPGRKVTEFGLIGFAAQNEREAGLLPLWRRVQLGKPQPEEQPE